MTTGFAPDPAIVGPYRLVQQLGEGGMGVVHLAVDGQGRAVALKALRAHVAAEVDARLRLRREVDTLRRVRHPRVAQVLDADLEAGVPYLVTRFVPGSTLEAYVAAHGPLSARHVARLGVCLAEALDAIHAAGVVHRDLKPANVMMVDGDPVVIDFGIAHLVDESRITMAGLVMGTPGYLSPEVVDGVAVTQATDWWGWGATLAFAATGRAPFGVGSAELVLDRVRRGVPDLDGVAEPLRGVLAAALTLDPAHRPAAAVLVAGLLGVAPATGTPAPAAAVPAVSAPAGTAVAVTVPQRASPAPTELYRIPPTLAAGTVVHGPAAARPREQLPFGYPPGADPPTAVAPTVPQPTFPSVVAPPARLDQVPGGASGGLSPSPAPVLAVGLLALMATAAVAPGLAIVLAVLLMVLARTTDRTVNGLRRRRFEYGPRRSDLTVTVLALPWRLVTSVAMSAPALIVPVLVAISADFIAAAARAQGLRPDPRAPLALAVGLAAGVLVGWWGPGGGSVRRGTRILVRGVTRRPHARTGVMVALVVVVATALAMATQGASPDWSLLRLATSTS